MYTTRSPWSYKTQLRNNLVVCSRIPKNVKAMKINPNWMVTHTSLLKVSIQTNKLKAKSICVNLKSMSVRLINGSGQDQPSYKK